MRVQGLRGPRLRTGRRSSRRPRQGPFPVPSNLGRATTDFGRRNEAEVTGSPHREQHTGRGGVWGPVSKSTVGHVARFQQPGSALEHTVHESRGSFICASGVYVRGLTSPTVVSRRPLEFVLPETDRCAGRLLGSALSGERKRGTRRNALRSPSGSAEPLSIVPRQGKGAGPFCL